MLGLRSAGRNTYMSQSKNSMRHACSNVAKLAPPWSQNCSAFMVFATCKNGLWHSDPKAVKEAWGAHSVLQIPHELRLSLRAQSVLKSSLVRGLEVEMYTWFAFSRSQHIYVAKQE